jgi:SAM-dependent methyltransferase
MAGDLRKTWNDAAARFDDWGPPLRPCPEDIRIMQEMIADWHRENRAEKPRIFLCGVTPEIVSMPWPFPIELIGMDQAESMVRSVWPGDLPGIRRGVVGNWLESGLAPGSQDVVIGDGGFAFFAYPDAQRALMAELHRVLAPPGLFLYRHFGQIENQESLDLVISAARSGGIGSFHAFKWRLAMALQADGSRGVRQHDIWTAWTQSAIDPARLPQPGWSVRAVSTIDLYEDKQARLYFPTVREFTTLLEEHYSVSEVRLPGYELGERCPIIAATLRV